MLLQFLQPLFDFQQLLIFLINLRQPLLLKRGKFLKGKQEIIDVVFHIVWLAIDPLSPFVLLTQDVGFVLEVLVVVEVEKALLLELADVGED